MNVYTSLRQANSLIGDVVDTDDSRKFQSATEDTILYEHNQGQIDVISMTMNESEAEAFKGMQKTFGKKSHIRLFIARRYKREGKKICHMIEPFLTEQGFRVCIGKKGGVLAWR